MSDDVMDTLAGLPRARRSPRLRRQRPDVVKHLQGSDDAIFAPAGRRRPDARRTRGRGAARRRRCCATARSRRITARGSPRSTRPARSPRPWRAGAHITEVRWDAILAHVDLVTRGPGSAERKDIDNLLAAGLSSHAVVSLSQLIAYVNFQSRVLAGLRMLKGAA